MDSIFITDIKVEESRNIKNFSIPLSKNERKHLIITGKNGSGKTSLLNDIGNFLGKVRDGSYKYLKANLKSLNTNRITEQNLASQQNPDLQYLYSLRNSIKNTEDWLKSFGDVMVHFSDEFDISQNAEDGIFIITFFDAKRHAELTIPSGIQKIDLRKDYMIGENANINFIQYIVNLKADRSFAKDDGEIDAVEAIDKWFQRFEESLKEIFNSKNLQLKFDRKGYNFEIIEPGKIPFTFNNLSSGYSAIISIITELILRMEAHQLKSYDSEGIVLIDEIETHLHVELQKKILPFLTSFFPKIQFIVTTHSPFILNSIENSVICDLEKKIVTENLADYSYDTLIESYFDSDNYSELLKRKISEYEELVNAEDLTPEKTERRLMLKNQLNEIPKFAADELAVKLQQIELQEINKRNKRKN